MKFRLSRIKSSGRKVKLWWCPGHLEIPGNDKAAQAANTARYSGKLFEYDFNLQCLFKELKKKFMKSHSEKQSLGFIIWTCPGNIFQ